MAVAYLRAEANTELIGRRSWSPRHQVKFGRSRLIHGYLFVLERRVYIPEG